MYSFETRTKALSIADVFATPRMTRSTFETTLTIEPPLSLTRTGPCGGRRTSRRRVSPLTATDEKRMQQARESQRARATAIGCAHLRRQQCRWRAARWRCACTATAMRRRGASASTAARIWAPISVKRVRTFMYCTVLNWHIPAPARSFTAADCAPLLQISYSTEYMEFVVHF